jgi:hypothetical protein
MNPVEHGKQPQAPSSLDRAKRSPVPSMVVGFLMAMMGSAIVIGTLMNGRALWRAGGRGVSAAEHPIFYSLIVAFWLAWAGAGVWVMRKAARRILAEKAAEFPEDH